MEYIFKFTHYAIGGVAVQYLHPQGTPLLQLGSSRSDTLRRSLFAPGLASGFQQAVNPFFVIPFAVVLAFLGILSCLAA